MLTRSIAKILDNLDIEDHPVGIAYKQVSEGYLIYVGESVLSTYYYNNYLPKIC